jgi:hypothetical protein
MNKDIPINDKWIANVELIKTVVSTIDTTDKEIKKNFDLIITLLDKNLEIYNNPVNFIDKPINKIDKPINFIDKPVNKNDKPVNKIDKLVNKIDKPVNKNNIIQNDTAVVSGSYAKVASVNSQSKIKINNIVGFKINNIKRFDDIYAVTKYIYESNNKIIDFSIIDRKFKKEICIDIPEDIIPIYIEGQFIYQYRKYCDTEKAYSDKLFKCNNKLLHLNNLVYFYNAKESRYTLETQHDDDDDKKILIWKANRESKKNVLKNLSYEKNLDALKNNDSYVTVLGPLSITDDMILVYFNNIEKFNGISLWAIDNKSYLLYENHLVSDEGLLFDTIKVNNETVLVPVIQQNKFQKVNLSHQIKN